MRSIGSDLRMDYTAVGQTTHLAARMEQLAVPGVDPAHRRHAAAGRGLRAGQAARARARQGAERAGRGLRADRRRRGASRLQAAAARGLTRFVGRDAELEQLRQALEQAGAGPRPGRGPRGRARCREVAASSGSSLTPIGRRAGSSSRAGSVSYGKATTLPAGDRPAQGLLPDREPATTPARSARR